MKKIVLVLAMFAWVSLNAQTQTKAPAADKKAPAATEKKAPAATEKKAPVAQTKVAAPVKTAIEVAKLPKEILDNIANDHKGFKAIKAESVLDKGVTTYVVTVEGNNTKLNYIYDKDKKFVKEEAFKEEVKKPAAVKAEPKKEPVKAEPKKEPVKAEPKKEEPKKEPVAPKPTK